MSSSSEKHDSINKKHSIKQALKRQLTIFPSFLAPPPHNPQTLLSETHVGVKNHSFKKAINKLASCFLFGSNSSKGVVTVNEDCCSHQIPFEIQEDIMKRLPVKSLVRFRCVSKQWKSLIDSSEFVKGYQGMNHHILVRYNGNEYVSIFDNDDTFPVQKSAITVPLPVLNLCSEIGLYFDRPARILGSSHGLICLYGLLRDKPTQITDLVVLWNPSISKSVTINIEYEYIFAMCIGFGVCPETLDPKIVIFNIREVKVYTLSSKVWKRLSVKLPSKSVDIISERHHEGVSVKGFIYWIMGDLILSFDVTNEEFGQFYLPDCLQSKVSLKLSKRNECLTVIHFDLEESVFGVWMMKDDGVTKSFTKMFSIETSGVFFNHVIEFRKNGEAIIALIEVDHSMLQVYDPCLGRISGDLGIEGIQAFFYGVSICSYMETLLLLDE